MKVSLQCAIVGQAGSSFDVEIDDSEKVSKLKKAIAEDQKFDFAASKLQLFLAKVPKEKQGEVERTEEVKDELQEDMTWLYSRSEDVKKLKKGEKTPLIEALTMERHELQGEDPLEDVLSGIDPPSVRQIHVLVVVPKGGDVERSTVANAPIGPCVNTSSCDELLAFLEGEMTNKEKILSNPHILDRSGLQFRLTGRQGAIETAAKCFRQIIDVSRTTGSDPTQRPIPVCSGISGLGKTRMLEEGVTILKRLKLDPERIVHVLVPYSKGYNPTPMERSMPIVASFSWRLLYRFFLGKNCAVPFEKWFTSRLPYNGDELLLSEAIEVIERKLRQRVQRQESLYLFLGIDEYQKIEEVGASRSNPHTTIVRELVNAISNFLCTQSSGLVVLPMFAGTDLGIIASGSIANPSCYVTKRLPMTLLTLSEVVTSVESNAEFAGFLRDNHIRRHLFALGGVPRWVVEFLLRLKKCTQPDDSSEPRELSVESIDNCFNEVWATYVASYANSIDFHRLVRLAAFAVSNQQVVKDAPFDDGWKWSQLRDSALCLLNPSGHSDACDVQVPYASLRYIANNSTFRTDFRTDEERAFAMSLLDMKKLVDKNLFDLEPWQSWEKFGACFYAMRINALLVLGRSTVTLGELLRGAQMTPATSEISVELVPSRVFQCEEKFGHSTPQFVSHKGHLSETIDWTSSGNIFVNGANGEAVDIFFALKDARSGNLIVFVDQRKREFRPFQPCLPKKYLGKLKNRRPAFLGGDTRLVGGVMSCVAPSKLEKYEIPDDCFLLTRDETFRGTLAYHPACSPFVPINSANKTALLSVLSGSKGDKDEAAKEIMRKRSEPSGGFTDYEAMHSRFKAMKLEVEIDCNYAVWTR